MNREMMPETTQSHLKKLLSCEKTISEAPQAVHHGGAFDHSMRHSAVCGLGLVSNHTSKIFKSERLLLFWVPQINDKKVRGEELSCGSMHWHCVSSEP